MSTHRTDALVDLINSLTKAEKRSFRLFVTRNQDSEDILFVQLFDEISRLKTFEEEVILERVKGIKKRQLSNLKAHLYKQLLVCLRLLSKNKKSEIEIRELSDYAKILYNKGLYRQGIEMLNKAKRKAFESHQYIQALDLIEFEKFIESQYITRSIENKAEKLKKEADFLRDKVVAIQHLSNVAMQLYAYFLRVGHVRTEAEIAYLNDFFNKNIRPEYESESNGFYENLYLYQSYGWYHYIRQDFPNYFKYSKKWLDLFEEYPEMLQLETPIYLKGIHNVLNALFMSLRYEKFVEALAILESVPNKGLLNSRNDHSLFYLYKYYHFFNKHFLCGTFSEGVLEVKELERIIVKNPYNWDTHRIMVFYYKIACLYFGSGDWNRSITFLNKIIQEKTQDFRTDIQCFARILNLIAHYELGNRQLLEYQVKSVYRYLGKMEELQKVQSLIFKFLRKIPRMVPSEVKDQFKGLKDKLVLLQNDPVEKRAFLYLDIISWLESKIKGLSVEEVIQQKFRERTTKLNPVPDSNLSGLRQPR